MKTTEEKARELMDFIGTDCSGDLLAITAALTKQDQKTRHACAEAINELDGDTIRKADAYIACLKVCAV